VAEQLSAFERGLSSVELVRLEDRNYVSYTERGFVHMRNKWTWSLLRGRFHWVQNNSLINNPQPRYQTELEECSACSISQGLYGLYTYSRIALTDAYFYHNDVYENLNSNLGICNDLCFCCNIFNDAVINTERDAAIIMKGINQACIQLQRSRTVF
jgi:hypothetical protein